MITPGTLAPDFIAASTHGSPIQLSSFREKSNVLLAFFPLAFTSTCTAQLCDFSDDFELFSSASVTVLPISVDSVPTLREYKKAHGMKVELLSDFKRNISREYGVLNEERFHSNRAYFLIDRQGLVRWSFVEEVDRDKRSNDELLSQIALLGD